MINVSTLICYFFLFLFFLELFHLCCSIRWMKINRCVSCSHELCKKKEDVPLYLIVPVLNEQRIIEETYMHFRDIVNQFEKVYVVYVTTEKEGPCSITTYEMIKRLMEADVCNKKIYLFHYPYKKGVMAHQLNYAIDQLEKINPSLNFWIGIYNADSRISVSTIDYIINNINQKDCLHKCFQQYSWYITKSNKSHDILNSAALWQTRWTLVFELARVRFQAALDSAKLPDSIYSILEKMNYVIGHGLYIKVIDLKTLGGFPEDTINEDACLGYLLNCNNIKIIPIPFLEKAESPNRVSIYIKQQTTWFNGPWYAFQYWKCKMKAQGKNNVRYLLLAFKLFLHALYWLLAPILLLFICPICITNLYQLGLWIGTVLLYLPIMHFIVEKSIVYLEDIKAGSVPHASLWCIPFFAIHCFGPIRNLYFQLRKQNSIDYKYKTER